MFSVQGWILFEFLQFSLNVLNIFDLLTFCSSSFNNIFICATEPFSCFCLVFLIISKTQPAKPVLALTAGHVHTAWILLDWSFAFWALFGVELKPVLCILITVCDTVLPSLIEITFDWSVSFICTREAKFLAAVAFHIKLASIFTLASSLTIFTRTPFCLCRQIHKGLLNIVFVLCILFCRKEFHEEFCWNYHPTCMIWAGCKHTFWALIEFFFQILLKAIFAKWVATFLHDYCIIELYIIVTAGACELRVSLKSFNPRFAIFKFEIEGFMDVVCLFQKLILCCFLIPAILK